MVISINIIIPYLENVKGVISMEENHLEYLGICGEPVAAMVEYIVQNF